ncbi:MBL fold metallo-hydrolase, partial [Candidatus Kaiserbacteria bacterium]|nr:MBL fold metallo-hydrolase [Candidatus Kaiserbacteria bacterium]
MVNSARRSENYRCESHLATRNCYEDSSKKNSTYGWNFSRYTAGVALKLSFYGGAGKVTGSNFLIEGARGKVLVDCGIEQGADFVQEHIYGPFPYDVENIDALVLTHAHLDHVGRIPKLVHD